MLPAKENMKDAASSAKEHAKILEAKVEEQAQKATARTAEEKKIAEERRKAKEAEAKVDLHEAKARHAEETLRAKTTHHLPGHHPAGAGTCEGHAHLPGAAGYDANVPGHYPTGAAIYDGQIGTGNPMAGATAPTYPPGGYVPPPAGHRKHL